jgi:diguanylate cyclase (GGDEF)-like protein
LSSRRRLVSAFSAGSVILGVLLLPLFVFDVFEIDELVPLLPLTILIGVATAVQGLVFFWMRSGRRLQAAGAASAAIQASTCIGVALLARGNGTFSLAALMFTVVPLMLAGSVLDPLEYRIIVGVIQAGALAASAALFPQYGWIIVVGPLIVLVAGAFIIYASGRVAHDLELRDGQHLIEEARLGHEATTDPLTGLLNRRGFVVAAESELRLARRQGAGVTLVYLDVDELKAVNDARGHVCGDDLLCRTACLLSGVLRASDLVGRIGGDEFAVFALDDLRSFAAQLVEATDRHNSEDVSRPPVRLSHGVVYAPPEDERSLEELLCDADGRMYAAKRSGRTARG